MRSILAARDVTRVQQLIIRTVRRPSGWHLSPYDRPSLLPSALFFRIVGSLCFSPRGGYLVALVRIQIDFGMSCELYQRVLGNDWWALAEPVRRAHAVGEESRGCFRVSHGEGWLARQLARWSHLPQPANAASTVLKIHEEGAGQRWERRFDGHAFTTRQWAEDGRHLVERFRSWELHFELQVAEGTLSYVQRRARLRLGRLRLPLPLALAPCVSARETCDGPERVRVAVTVTLPLVGVLIAYEGFLDLGGPAQ